MGKWQLGTFWPFASALATAWLACGIPTVVGQVGGGTDSFTGAEVVVQVEGLRNDDGSVLAALFSDAERFPQQGAEVAVCTSAIRDGRARCSLGVVASGRYAIAILHDENGDGQLNRDWLGLPAEGYGFSRDASSMLGPPHFDLASFPVRGDRQIVSVRARYGL